MKSHEFARLQPESRAILEMLIGFKSVEEAFAAHPELKMEDLMTALDDLKKHLPEITGLAGAPKRAAKRSESKQSQKRSSNADGYQIKITLAQSKPPIGRRIVVPCDIILEDLSDVIKAVMGWGGGHLHAFEIHGEIYDGLWPDGSEPEDRSGQAAWTARLSEAVPSAKSTFRYDYDFGDDWRHKLLVEKIIPAAEKPALFTCTAGKGRCPLEDSGGIWGYYHMLQVLSKPDHPDHKWILEWCGGPIDPSAFSVEAANNALAGWRAGH